MKQVYRLLVFAEVVKQGSFTAAAEALGVNKSSVSQHITQLEAELDLRLINRTTRRLSLTEEGKYFAQRCLQIQALIQQSVQEVQTLAQNPQGTLSITAPFALESCLILPTLDELHNLFPKVRPRLLISDTHLDLVKQGIDLAISVGPLVDSSYHLTILGELREIFCASPAFIAQHDLISHPKELLKHPFITTSWQQKRTQQKFFRDQVEEESLRLPQDIKVNTLLSAVSLAEKGRGIVLLPDVFACCYLQSGKLIQVLPDWHGGDYAISAVHAYGKQSTLVINQFIELLKQHIAQSSLLHGS